MTGEIVLSDGLRLLVRRSGRARRMTLRVPRDGGMAVLTLPRSAALAEGRAFAESKAGWLRSAAERVPQPLVAAHGVTLPVEGRGLILTPAAVRVVSVEGDRLLLPASRPSGPVVQAFLKHLAHQRLTLACDTHAGSLRLPYRALVLRDTRSRWGSCSHDGRLMFSWRLAMAPPEVLDYVAAHEVAHLAQMDHSPRFWATVGRLMPEYERHRGWLRKNGSDLMAWRFRDA
ncbi:M48 family metallopeptidase [Paracoccus caeni]|uniref:M48 family metallopeptidase n=1 Tax=Paracoccus caeni TaxID=657651 RepID=A0A934SAL9_9RHOB|nr:SprT family zinc-dependent metalloprotease [Paracoccus caeni]MBK4215420.1 M48 family metallopeptidase [Paracoccus caeni]